MAAESDVGHGSSPSESPGTMKWGSHPDLFGPRHAFRVGMLMAELEQCLDRGMVLDVGSGPGTAVMALARRGFRVTGIELSPEFALLTAEKLRRCGLSDRAKIVLGDASALPFRESSFDAVLCGEVLEHLENDRSAVYEIFRLLRPGGVVVVTVPARPEAFDWLDSWAGHQRRYTAEILEALFLEAGLAVEKVRCWGFPFMALYERLVLRRVLGPRLRTQSHGGALRLSRNPILAGAMAMLFRLDRLFERLGRGNGLLLVARKPKQPDPSSERP